MKHTWKIYDLKRITETGVVTKVTYVCESEIEGAYDRNIGEIELTGSNNDSGFIEYSELTENDVLSWIYSKIDKSSIETSQSSSLAQIIELQSGIIESNGTPWENN